MDGFELLKKNLEVNPVISFHVFIQVQGGKRLENASFLQLKIKFQKGWNTNISIQEQTIASLAKRRGRYIDRPPYTPQCSTAKRTASSWCGAKRFPLNLGVALRFALGGPGQLFKMQQKYNENARFGHRASRKMYGSDA